MLWDDVEHKECVGFRVDDRASHVHVVSGEHEASAISPAIRDERAPDEGWVFAATQDFLETSVFLRADLEDLEVFGAATCRFPHLHTQFGVEPLRLSRDRESGKSNDFRRSASVLSKSINPARNVSSTKMDFMVASSRSARNGAISSGVGSPCTVFILIAMRAAWASVHPIISTQSIDSRPSSRHAIAR